MHANSVIKDERTVWNSVRSTLDGFRQACEFNGFGAEGPGFTLSLRSPGGEEYGISLSEEGMLGLVEALHAGSVKIVQQKNNEIRTRRISDSLVEQLRAGGDVSELVAAAVHKLVGGGRTQFMASISQGSLSLAERFRAIAESPGVHESEAGDDLGLTLISIANTSDWYTLVESLRGALRAAAERVGGMDDLLGGGSHVVVVRKLLEEHDPVR